MHEEEKCQRYGNCMYPCNQKDLSSPLLAEVGWGEEVRIMPSAPIFLWNSVDSRCTLTITILRYSYILCSLAVAVGVSDMWQVTGDRWHMTGDAWHLIHDTWLLCFFFYVKVSVQLSAHIERFSVSHMC